MSSQCSGTFPNHSTRVLVGWVGLAGSDIDLARHGLVDDGLLLLLHQLDQPFLGPDVAPDAPVGVVEEADDAQLAQKGAEGTRGMGLHSSSSVNCQAGNPMPKVERT